jgi:hypothetical protein
VGQWWVGGHQPFVPVPSAVGGFLAEAEVSAEGAAVAEVGGDLVGEEFIGPYQPRYFHSPIMQPMREGTVTAPRRAPGADPSPTFAHAQAT